MFLKGIALARRSCLIAAKQRTPFSSLAFSSALDSSSSNSSSSNSYSSSSSSSSSSDGVSISTGIEGELKAKKLPVIDEQGRAYGTGRRKTSVARVWIKEGSGQFIVNHKSFVDYFQPVQREHTLSAFLASRTAGAFDVWCTVKGGGMSGQAGAVRLGISRALEAFNPSLRPSLKAAGMLTRDSRRVERKKPGQKKARKKFQWVKR